MPSPSDFLARLALAGALLSAGVAGGAGALAQPARDCPPAAPAPDSAQQSTLLEQARDRGLLWQVQKDGRTSWLYGTVHLGRLDQAVPGPRIRAALAASDVVALELDPADPDLPRALMAPHQPGRADRVLAGLQPRMERAAERTCAPVVASMRPLVQLTTLALWEARREGLHPEHAVDVMLWGLAQGLRKPVVGLETAALQIAALTPDSEADERELLDRGLQDLEAGRVRPLMRKMVEVWAAGDEVLLADYPRWCQCVETETERRYYQRLNDSRNPALADRLAALHAGRRFFAGVGALHMTGPQALPDLLRARGFDVQRVRFDPLPKAP